MKDTRDRRQYYKDYHARNQATDIYYRLRKSSRAKVNYNRKKESDPEKLKQYNHDKWVRWRDKKKAKALESQPTKP